MLRTRLCFITATYYLLLRGGIGVTRNKEKSSLNNLIWEEPRITGDVYIYIYIYIPIYPSKHLIHTQKKIIVPQIVS